MSDYLWDRKGEPEAEVARLEALLGAFRHEPRPLELPAEAAAPEPRPAGLLTFAPRPRASRLFAPAALAAAAALAVASVVVASVFLRAQRPAAHVAGEVKLSFPAGAKDRPASANVVVEDEKVEAGKVKDEKVAVESLPRVTRQRKEAQLAAVPGRRRPRLPAAEPSKGEGLTLEQMSTPGGASSLVESARLLTKEQLIYALRFTGAKLRDVREKAQNSRQ